MASKKIWKISDFSGGLNNYTNSYDISSSEFVEFQNLTAKKRGVISPLGANVRNETLPQIKVDYDSNDLNPIIPGGGLHSYNANYTYFGVSGDGQLSANIEQVGAGINGYNLLDMKCKLDSCMWIFKTAYPVSGDLYVQAKINGVPIMEKVTMLSGHWISGSYTENKFNKPTYTTTGIDYSNDDSEYHRYSGYSTFENIDIQSPISSIPYEVCEAIGYQEFDSTKRVTELYDARFHYQTQWYNQAGGEFFGQVAFAPSAWSMWNWSYSEDNSVTEVNHKHTSFWWWSNEFHNNYDTEPPNFYVSGGLWNHYEINDKRWPLGWDGTDAQTRRFAVGPSKHEAGYGFVNTGTYQRPGDCPEPLFFGWLTSVDSNYNSMLPSYWPAATMSYFPYVWSQSDNDGANAYKKAAKHTYDVMMRSISREIVKGINSYDNTILTVDDLTRPDNHTAWQTGQTHTSVLGVSDGDGLGLTCNISTDGSGYTTFVIVTGGKGYAINEEITFTDPGSTSNTAVLIVATLGGTDTTDSFDAEFTANSNSSLDQYQPHLLNIDVASSDDWEFKIDAPLEGNLSIPEDTPYYNLQIHLTSASLATDRDYIHASAQGGTLSNLWNTYGTGTPVQISQYAFVDSGINCPGAITAEATSIIVNTSQAERFLVNDVILINDGSNPEMMMIKSIKRIEGYSQGFTTMEVIRGDTNFFGTGLGSTYSSQWVAHNTGADIYKDAISLWNAKAHYVEDGNNPEYPSSDIDYINTDAVPMTGIICKDGQNSLKGVSQMSAPFHYKLTLYGNNINSDGLSFKILGFGEGTGGTNWLSEEVVIPQGAASSLEELETILKTNLGTVKKNASDTIVTGISGIASGYNGTRDDGQVQGGRICEIYIVPVDTSKTMATASGSTGFASNISTLTELAITAGMNNFLVGDCVCWQGNDDDAGPGLKEIARVHSKSGTGSSGTIVLERNIDNGEPQTIYSLQVLTKCNSGIGDNQNISIENFEILYGQIISDISFIGEEVFHILLTQSGIESDFIFDNGNIASKVRLNLFSTISNSWVNTDETNLNGYSLNNKLGWIYGNPNIPIEATKPVLFSEGGKLRLADANLNLPNKNMLFMYLDIGPFFNNLTTTIYSTWEFPGNIFIKGFGMFNNEIEWDYTVVDSDLADSLIKGLSLSNDSSTVIANLNSYFTDDFARMYVQITKNSSTTTGIDWSGVCRFYAVAVYEDGSETLPVHKFDTDLDFGDGEEDGFTDSLNVEIFFRPISAGGDFAFDTPRIKGIRLYYTNEADNFIAYNSLGIIDFELGFIKASSIRSVDDSANIHSSYLWKDKTQSPNGATDFVNALYIYNVSADNDTIVYDNMPVEETYEIDNLYKPTETHNLNVRYKTITMAGKRAFAGNLLVEEMTSDNYGKTKKHFPDGMIVSPIDKLDVFPYPSNLLELDISDGSNIIALSSVGDKVLQFKENIMYIVNISSNIEATFFIEERHKYKGIMDSNHVCETSHGIFWFNNRTAYLYDGNEVKDLFIKGGSKEDEKAQRRIHPDIWEDFIMKESMCGYNPKSEEIFVIKSYANTSNSNGGDCYVYSIMTDTWSLGKDKFWTGAGTDLILADTSPTIGEGNLTATWGVINTFYQYLTPVSTSGNGEGLILKYATDISGNPLFIVHKSGFGYKFNDIVVFQDPTYNITGGTASDIPTATLKIATEAAYKFITNFINIGHDSKLSFFSSGSIGELPGPDGDGSPL